MAADSWLAWPLCWRRNLDRIVTENHALRQTLWDTQKELMKHRRLLADLAGAHRETEEMFARAVNRK